MPASIPGFIGSSEETFTQHLTGLQFLIMKARAFPEFKHLQHKWPNMDFNIRHSSHVQLSQCLTPTLKVCGLYIPLQFRLYTAYETQSHPEYELTMAYPQYRESLSQLIIKSQQQQQNALSDKALNNIQNVFNKYQNTPLLDIARQSPT